MARTSLQAPWYVGEVMRTAAAGGTASPAAATVSRAAATAAAVTPRATPAALSTSGSMVARWQPACGRRAVVVREMWWDGQWKQLMHSHALERWHACVNGELFASHPRTTTNSS